MLKTNAEACSDLPGECDSSVGLSCQSIDGSKICS